MPKVVKGYAAIVEQVYWSQNVGLLLRIGQHTAEHPFFHGETGDH